MTNLDKNNFVVFSASSDSVSAVSVSSIFYKGVTSSTASGRRLEIADDPSTLSRSRRVSLRGQKALDGVLTEAVECIVQYVMEIPSTQAAGFSSASEAYQTTINQLQTAVSSGTWNSLVSSYASTVGDSIMAGVTTGTIGFSDYTVTVNQPAGSSGSGEALTSGQISGVVIGVVIAVALGCFCAYYYGWRLSDSYFFSSDSDPSKDNGSSSTNISVANPVRSPATKRSYDNPLRRDAGSGRQEARGSSPVHPSPNISLPNAPSAGPAYQSKFNKAVKIRRVLHNRSRKTKDEDENENSVELSDMSSNSSRAASQQSPLSSPPVSIDRSPQPKQRFSLFSPPSTSAAEGGDSEAKTSRRSSFLEEMSLDDDKPVTEEPEVAAAQSPFKMVSDMIFGRSAAPAAPQQDSTDDMVMGDLYPEERTPRNSIVAKEKNGRKPRNREPDPDYSERRSSILKIDDDEDLNFRRVMHMWRFRTATNTNSVPKPAVARKEPSKLVQSNRRASKKGDSGSDFDLEGQQPQNNATPRKSTILDLFKSSPSPAAPARDSVSMEMQDIYPNDEMRKRRVSSTASQNEASAGANTPPRSLMSYLMGNNAANTEGEKQTEATDDHEGASSKDVFSATSPLPAARNKRPSLSPASLSASSPPDSTPSHPPLVSSPANKTNGNRTVSDDRPQPIVSGRRVVRRATTASGTYTTSNVDNSVKSTRHTSSHDDMYL